MLPKNTTKLLRFLLRNPEKVGYNINQLARFIKISVGSSFKILKELEKSGIVSVKKIGNANYYSLNLDNPETIKLCELLLIEEKRYLTGYAKLYAESLQEFAQAEMIVLFGSVLKNKEFKDVDVLFVTKNVKQVNQFCLEISKLRTRPVVPLILKKEDLIRELKTRNESLLSLIKEGVVLKGGSVFVGVIRHAQA